MPLILERAISKDSLLSDQELLEEKEMCSINFFHFGEQKNHFTRS